MNELDARSLFNGIEYLVESMKIERYINTRALTQEEIDSISDRLYESGVRIYEVAE